MTHEVKDLHIDSILAICYHTLKCDVKILTCFKMTHLHHLYFANHYISRVRETPIWSSFIGDKSDSVPSVAVAASCLAHAEVAAWLTLLGTTPPQWLTLSSSWFFSSSWHSKCLIRSSMLPWRSSAYSWITAQTGQKEKKRGHDDLCAWQPEGQQRKMVATTQAKASTPNSKMDTYVLKRNWKDSWLKQTVTRRKMENKATKGQNERGRELLQHCQVWAPARSAMQLSHGGRTARAESQ